MTQNKHIDMPPKIAAKLSSSEKASLKKLKHKENMAKANPAVAAANKEVCYTQNFIHVQFIVVIYISVSSDSFYVDWLYRIKKLEIEEIAAVIQKV